MAEFIEELQSFKPFMSEKNSNMNLMENQTAIENFDSNDPGFISLSNSIMFDQIPMDFLGEFQRESGKGKAVIEGRVVNLSPSSVSEAGVSLDKRNGGKKRRRNTEKQKPPQEVVHVRAKRGQATDSHSLAERVRRERINEKLRCLQDLVPGCYKTMGMAVMLEVIINYVQSLQNQIDFLSMKLTTASMYSDINMAEMEATQTETMEGQEMHRQGYGGASYFNSNPHGLFECDH